MATHKTQKALLDIGLIAIGAAVVVIAYFLWSLFQEVQQMKMSAATDSPQINSVSYACAGGATIQAQFFNNTAELTLGDGRSFLLSQGIAASGVRYTNSDESITFWTKGNTAFLQEGKEISINNCVEQTN